MGNISKYFHFNVNSLTEEEDEVFAKSSVFFFVFFYGCINFNYKDK